MEIPGQPGGVTLDRRAGPGGSQTSEVQEQPKDVVLDEHKIVEEESAVRMPAPVMEGPRRSSRKVGRPDRYTE